MPDLSPAAAPFDEPKAEEPRLFSTGAEAASYIGEVLSELADMAQTAGHRRLSDAILVAALQAARAADRSTD